MDLIEWPITGDGDVEMARTLCNTSNADALRRGRTARLESQWRSVGETFRP